MDRYSFDMPMLLALHDYLPVIFSAVGLCLLAMMMRRVHRTAGLMAWAGFALVVAGGVFKASYKLDAATVGAAPAWMDLGIFAWMGPGFTLLAVAIFNVKRVLRGREALRPIWALPALLLALEIGAALYLGLSNPASPAWRLMLLGVTTIGNFVLGGLAAAESFRQGQKLAGALFIVNLVAVFLLQGMARIDQDSLGLQWGQQTLNMISQMAFAYAAWRLHDATAPMPIPAPTALERGMVQEA